MDYKKIYDQIILRSQNEHREKIKGGQYFENHHITPISLGRVDKKENLVLLTAREHFICHKLLVEIYPNNNKLIYALWGMSTQVAPNQLRDYKVNNRGYERLRIIVSEIVSKKQKGKIPPKEKNEKQRQFMLSDKNPFRGKSHTEETKQIDREKNSGSKGFHHSEESIQLMRKPRLDKSNYKHTEEWKLDHSKKMKGGNNPMSGYKHERGICKYCSIEVDLPNLNRWHNDNCKLNPNKN